MLSAQKQEMPGQQTPEGSRPATTGFGKVLNSIQGLQQRLDSFSVEDVSRTHAQAHQLIRELGALQARLIALTKLGAVTLGINSQIASLTEPNYDLVDADSLESFPQLHAIIETAEDLRTELLVRSAQASAEPVSSAAEADATRSISLEIAAPTRIENSPEESITLLLGEAASSAVAQITGVVTPAHEAQSPSTITHASKAPRTYQFSDLKLEETELAAPLAKKDPPQSNLPGGKDAPSRKSKKTKGKVNFDQRLLDELIETYGEFAIPANPSEAAEQPKPAQAQASVTEALLVSAQGTPPETLPVEAEKIGFPENEPMRAEPAFVQTSGQELIVLPEPAAEPAAPTFDEAPTSAKSRGEIDRQLKSIIKDYGEVDLYSHRKTTNMKAVTMAAAAALVLLLSAFYFFKSPSTPAPTSIERTVPARETPISAR
jgi:hypothetical protein